MNITIAEGHLGQDAIIKPVGDKGTILFAFNLATDAFVGGQTETTWEQVKYLCYSPKYAEVLKPRLVKGAHVFVQGSPCTERWNDDEGNPCKARKLYADIVKVLASPAENPNRGAQDKPQRNETTKPMSAPRVPEPDFIGLPD